MQPTPAEVIIGIRRILKEVVEPAVESEYARNRLAEVRAVLVQIDWNDSLTQLATDNAAVQELARESADWIQASPDRVHAFAGNRLDLLDVYSQSGGEIEPFVVHNERSIAQANAMILLTDELAAWVRGHPVEDGAGELLNRVRRHYALRG